MTLQQLVDGELEASSDIALRRAVDGVEKLHRFIEVEVGASCYQAEFKFAAIEAGVDHTIGAKAIIEQLAAERDDLQMRYEALLRSLARTHQ